MASSNDIFKLQIYASFNFINYLLFLWPCSRIYRFIGKIDLLHVRFGHSKFQSIIKYCLLGQFVWLVRSSVVEFVFHANNQKKSLNSCFSWKIDRNVIAADRNRSLWPFMELNKLWHKSVSWTVSWSTSICISSLQILWAPKIKFWVRIFVAGSSLFRPKKFRHIHFVQCKKCHRVWSAMEGWNRSICV